ncbi:ABC transporter substrate-binding protein [Streptomyces sp. NPDC020490]|uniref:ABC transporter substrate-binding protein n=1 Tax=Streptomyces sp. NPDC020490 TaxID=3365078 RepID=UPI0037912A55
MALPLAAGLLLTACGSGGGTSANGEEPKTITLSYASANTGEKAFETLAKDYMAAHPGVHIKTNRIALNTYNQTLTTQMQAGNGPDVMYVNAGTGQAGSVGQLGKAGLLLELDSSLKSVLPEGTEELYSADGKFLGVPVSLAVSGIVYNNDLAEKSGVTITPASTLQDVLSQCAKAKKAGKSVFGLAGSISQNTGLLTMAIASSTVYGPNPNWNEDRAAGKTSFAKTEGWRQALQAVVDLKKAGCFQDGAAGAGFDALTNGASQGKLFGFFAPSGATKDIMDAAHGAVKLTALPFPAPKGTKTYPALTANIGLAGNARTKSPKLVQSFIEFAVSPAEAKKFADAQGSIPVGKSISPSDLLPQYQPIADMLKNKQYRPYGIDAWPNGQIYDALGSGVTGLLTGQKSVGDVLKAADAAWTS